MSPFKALYNQDCLMPLRLDNPSIAILATNQTLEEMDGQLKIIRENIKRASDRQKRYVDKHSSPREFNQGDMVFL